MNISYLCVLFAAASPYVYVALAKYPFRKDRGYDNHVPRGFADALQGWKKRAYWAHLNAFEAFAPFAVAVILAELAGVAQSRIDALSVVFVLCRMAHGVFYIGDKPTLRSAVWFLGMLAVLALFLSAIGTNGRSSSSL